MKKTVVFLLVLMAGFSIGCAKAPPVVTPPPINKDWTITVTFDFNFTNFNACSVNVPNGCITGFTWGYLNGATQVPLGTPKASICTGASQPQLCSDVAQSKLPIGAVVFYAGANYIDNKGVAGMSNVITTASNPTQITAGSVGNLQVTTK